MLILGLIRPKTIFRLTVSISNGFGLFQQLNYNLLQSAFYTDRLVNVPAFISKLPDFVFAVSYISFQASLARAPNGLSGNES